MTSPDSTIVMEILSDPRVNHTACRLYLLLQNGKTFEAAARALQKNPEWLRRYERELVDLGYLEINDVQARGIKERRYIFHSPDHPQSIAS